MLWLVWSYGFNAVWYGTKNGVSADQTYVETKPTDCDYYEEREVTSGTGGNKSLHVQWVKVKED
jgi:hypothetical protein